MTSLAYKMYELMSDGNPYTAKDIKLLIPYRYKIIKNLLMQGVGRGQFEKVGLSGKSMMFKLTAKGFELYEQRKREMADTGELIYTPKVIWVELGNAWR